MRVEQVIKRDGSVAPFDRRRIERAIHAAARAVGNGESRQWAETLSWAVVGIVEERFGRNGHVPHVEEIQDVVEELLIKSGKPQVAKAYILYRQKRAEARATQQMLLDTEKLVDDYLERLDWRVSENSNMNYSLQGLNFYLASSIAARYWLHKTYPPEVQQAHTEGDLHIHDLGMLSSYCCGWDLQDLLIRGFGGVPAKIESKPPRHLRTALGQLVNFFYTLQGEVAGAVAVSNFDTLLAPFIRYDGLDYRGIKQAVQEFVFNINVPTRVGFQSLVWDELVVVRRRGRVEVVEIGQLVDGQFERNGHRVLSQGNGSYAVANADDVQALAFDGDGEVIWAPVKAFVRHRVPNGAPFVRVRTSRGTAATSQAHSLFAFEEMNGHFSARPMTARDVEVVHGNAALTPTNHFIAVRHAPNGGTRTALDLTELIDAVPQIAARTRVLLPDPVRAVERLRERVRERFGGFTPFYLEYGIKDKGCWRRWAQSGSLPYLVWRALGEDEGEARFSLRNSDLWYGRTLSDERLGEFVRLLAWYVAEGHNDITNGLYVSQARGGDQEEIVRVLSALGALGRVEETQGWPALGNPTREVLRMAGKGLLASLIGHLGGTYSSNKVVPWFVYDLAHDLQEEFIATLIRGDGSDYDRYYDLTTTSKKLSLGLSLLLAMNGYKFSVYETSRHPRGASTIKKESSERRLRPQQVEDAGANSEQRSDRIEASERAAAGFDTLRYSTDAAAWSDQYVLRIYKAKSAAERYEVGDLLARVCSKREAFAYDRAYEYDLSVDTTLENFVGGSGLLCFHNTPFTNITMDLTPSPVLRDQAVIIGGELQEATYGEFQEEMDLLNRAFAEVMLEGDAKSRVFTFPIPTFNVTRDFDWESSVLEPVWAMTARYGIPYFCLEESTAVFQSNHTAVPIKSVRVGEELLGEEGQPVRITAVFHQQVDEIVQIKLASGREIIATPTHCFPTQNGLKRAEELSLHDKLLRAVLPGLELSFSNLTISMRELEEFFNLFQLGPDLQVERPDAVQVKSGQILYLQPKPFSKEDPTIEFEYEPNDYDTTSQDIQVPASVTPQFSRFLGYLVGDGYYAKSNHTITFVNSEDELLTDYKTCLDDLFGVRHQTGQAGHSEVAIQVSVNSAMLRALLHELGLQRVTARDKVVPHIIYRCSQEGAIHFIRGLFDSDGSVHKKRLITFASASEELAKQVQILLLRLGIMANYRREGDHKHKLVITGSNVNRYAEIIGSTSSRKTERLSLHAVRPKKNSLGDPLLEDKDQVVALVQEGRLPSHYRYNKLYKDCLHRVPRDALASRFPGAEPVFADMVNRCVEKSIEQVTIVRLSREMGQFGVVDISVDSPTHLFTLYGGILSHNSNFINSDMRPEDARSMCCRLKLDNRELRKRTGGLFAAAPLTGSLGVVTINLPRIGHLARDEAEFQERLQRLMEVGRTSLEIKRKMVETLTERRLYPYSRYYLGSIKAQTGGYWNNHFSTIGLIGMHEACLNLLGVGIDHPQGKAFAVRTLEFMREVLGRFQAETGNLYNLEATPAEGASYRLARADRECFPDIVTAGTATAPYYTNSTHLPVSFSDDLFEVLEHQDDLQTLYTGGTVVHIFLGEQLNDWRQARKLVRVVAENFHLPYFTLSPTFSICPVHGYIPGEHHYCPYEHTEEELRRFGRLVKE